MSLNWNDETKPVATRTPKPPIDLDKLDLADIKLGQNVDWDNMLCDSCQ